MLEKTMNSLVEKGVRGAALDMYVYPNGEFTIVPLGQSRKR